ncbi:MAG: glutathione S-transferase family protein [Myxococcales bacterium]|nr:glutathione S-transferase family protein [Myxococcales bacterium]
MSIVLHHHPFSRAAGTLWMLEEVGVPYELRYVDFAKREHKSPDFLALNPMGKLPTLVDDGVVVTENAAIGLYLADRYALGKLAPPTDDPRRGTYLRWSMFPSAVIEPGLMAKAAKWEFREGSAGWGAYDAMIAATKSAIAGRDYILGDTFSMADVIFGGTLRYMLSFGMLEPDPAFSAYAERLGQRPALQRADEKNAAILKEHGLTPPG